MSCHICKQDGTRECDPAAAEIRCMVCGKCEAERPPCFGTNPSWATQAENDCPTCRVQVECLL